MKLSNIWSWTKILTGFFSLQLLVQAISALIGIVIVRVVDKHEYAFYTITNAFLASASNMADSGITVALTAIGGRVWQDRIGFGRLINTAFSIRKWFTLIVIVFIVCSLPVMLFRNGATGMKISGLTGALILSVLFQFGAGIYLIVPQLHSDYKLLLRVALYSALLRAALLAIAWLTVLNSFTVVLMNCAAFAFTMWIYRRYARKQVDLTAAPDPDIRRSILRIVRKQVPYELYGVLSGQISIFLMTLFGTNSRVADVGALSRIGMLFAAMTGVLTNILIPRFVRCQDNKRLTGLFLKILLLFCAAVCSILIPVGLFPEQVIRILGSQYASLGRDCLLAVSVSVVATLLGAVWTINSSRGWIIPAWIGLSVGIGAQILSLLAFNIHTVHGVLMMGLSVNCAGLAINLLASLWFLHRASRNLDVRL